MIEVTKRPNRTTEVMAASYNLPVKYCLEAIETQIARRIPGHQRFVKNKTPILIRNSPFAIEDAFFSDMTILFMVNAPYKFSTTIHMWGFILKL